MSPNPIDPIQTKDYQRALYGPNFSKIDLDPPQSLLTVAPPPPLFDFEVIEEVATVFDNMIYNESGGGNDGQVAVIE